MESIERMKRREMLRVRVPGKILLTGEYAVLDGAPAIVAAVERFFDCEATPAEEFQIRGAGFSWKASGPDVPELCFAHQALRTALCYLKGHGLDIQPLAFELRDALHAPDGQKLGLGSSACVCVAIVSAVLAEARNRGLMAFDRALERDRIFKLAALAHGCAQKKAGSAVDVAASSFGGLILTQRFEMAPFASAFEISPKAFADTIDRSSVHFVEQLPAPCSLLLIFSGKSASTPAHITAVQQAAARHPDRWRRFIQESTESTRHLAQALKAQDMMSCLCALEGASLALEAFEPLTGIEITTPEHRALMAFAQERGLRAKPSGAGGGDCAFVLGEKPRLDRLERDLSKAGKLCLQTKIYSEAE